MFDESDPILHRVRGLALDLPEAREKISHGRPAFFTEKVFAYYGGSIKQDATWVQHPQSLVVLPDADEARALLESRRCFAPAYLGGAGWVGIDLDHESDWDEVAELLEDSYRRTARPRLLGQLDRR